MTASRLAPTADLVLDAHPSTCPHRPEAEWFADALRTADPGDKATYRRRRRAALVWLSTAPAGYAEAA